MRNGPGTEQINAGRFRLSLCGLLRWRRDRCRTLQVIGAKSKVHLVAHRLATTKQPGTRKNVPPKSLRIGFWYHTRFRKKESQCRCQECTMLYAEIKNHIWISFSYFWMTLASINARGLLQEMQWEKLTYPNPLTQPFECNRQDTSYICDPEGVLTSADADRLDFLANEIHQSTPCLCSSCATKDANGISLGIFLRSNLTHYERFIKDFSTAEMTRYIRKQWRLGPCDDDIVILVILEEKKSHFDMGDPVEEVMSREVADKIFSDCVIHFETGYYSQGLRSIVNSLYDNLRRSQKRKSKNENVSIGVIVGWSLGIASLILVIVLIIWRQRVRRARAKTLKTAGSWNETKTRKGIEYGVCETNDGESENEKNSNGSDAENPLEENIDDREMCVEKKLHLSQQYNIDSQEKEIICTNTETTDNFSANFRKIGNMEISEL